MATVLYLPTTVLPTPPPGATSVVRQVETGEGGATPTSLSTTGGEEALPETSYAAIAI